MSGLTPNSPTDDIYNGLPKSKQNPGAGACQDTKHDCYSGASASINDCESENKEPQGMGEPEGGEWIIIDMCDENGEFRSFDHLFAHSAMAPPSA